MILHLFRVGLLILFTPPIFCQDEHAKCDPLSAAIMMYCMAPLLQHSKEVPFHGLGIQSALADNACIMYAQYKRCASEEQRKNCYNMAAITDSIFSYVCNPETFANLSTWAHCLRMVEHDPVVAKCLSKFGTRLYKITSSKLKNLQEHNDVQCTAVEEFSQCAQKHYTSACGSGAWTTQLELIKRSAGVSSNNCDQPNAFLDMATIQKTQDVDECSPDTSSCSQRCEKESGPYRCHCDERFFELSSDGSSCIYKDSNVWIFFAHGQSLWNISLDGKNFQLLRGGIQKAAMLDVDVKEQMVYYVDVGADKLERIKFHGAFPQTIQDGGLSGTEGIGIDWIGRKLFLAKGSDLVVQNLDGRFRQILYTNVFKLPRALAVHPESAYVYNTDWGVQAFISKAAMDGSSFKRIVTTGLAWPNGLTIDHYSDRLYWADAFLDTIESTDLDGKSRRTILKDTNSIPHVFGLAVTGEHLYWTDWTFRGIMRCNKVRGDNVTLVAQTALLPYDLKLCHAASQPPLAPGQSPHPCTVNNGGCAQLCLLSPAAKRYRCACVQGFRLAANNRTCIANCGPDQIACLGDNAKCISRIYWCDGISHCANMEDERDCPKRLCSIGQFQCHNTTGCLSPQQLCDGHGHCADQSDEKYCSPSV